MEKTITIGNKECVFKTSGALPLIYRREFHRDLFTDMQGLKFAEDGLDADTVSVLEMCSYAMARHADKTIPEIEEWLESFTTFGLMEHVDEIVALWTDELETQSEGKKKSVAPQEN